MNRYAPSDWTYGNGTSSMRLSKTGPYVLYDDVNRHSIALNFAIRQAYALIENGMEVRAKTLLGSVLERNK